MAQSAGYAVEEARARGERFAGEDLDFAKQNLKTAGEMLTETLRYAAERATFESRTAAAELRAHAERAVDAVKPTVSSTVEALRDAPVQLASEATTTAVKGGRLAAGALLNAMSGMLAGAADLLDPARAGNNAPAQNASGETNAERAE